MEYIIDPTIFQSLVEDHKVRFNNGFASVTISSLGTNTAFFNTTLYSPEHWTNNISHNDPMKEHIMIEQVGEDSYIATLNGGSLTINVRPEDHYMAYSSVKCRFRKTKGNADKIIKAILKWQDTRLALVKEVKSEIPNIMNSNLKDI